MFRLLMKEKGKNEYGYGNERSFYFQPAIDLESSAWG